MVLNRCWLLIGLVGLMVVLLLLIKSEQTRAWGIGKPWQNGRDAACQWPRDLYLSGALGRDFRGGTHWHLTRESVRDVDINDGQEHDRIADASVKVDCWDIAFDDNPLHTQPVMAPRILYYWALHALQWRFECVLRAFGRCILVIPVKDYAARADSIGRVAHYIQDGAVPFHTPEWLTLLLIRTRFNAAAVDNCHDAFERYVDDGGWLSGVDRASVIRPPDPVGSMLTLYALNMGIGEPLVRLCDQLPLTNHGLMRSFIEDPFPVPANPIGPTFAAADPIINLLIKTTAQLTKGVLHHRMDTIFPPEVMPLLLETVNQFEKATQGQDVFFSMELCPTKMAAQAIGLGTGTPFPDSPSCETRNEIALKGVMADKINYNAEQQRENPELAILAFSIDPFRPKPGDQVKISALIVNWGAAVNDVEFQLLVDQVPFGQTFNGGQSKLNVGRLRGALLTWDAIWQTREGATRIELIIDPSGKIDESNTIGNQLHVNKENNRKVETIVVDQTPPVIALRQPVAGATYDAKEPLVVDFDATDTDALSGITIPAAVYGFLDDDKAKVVAKGSKIDLSELGSGPHKLKVVAIDAFGNATQRELTFIVSVGTGPPPPAGLKGFDVNNNNLIDDAELFAIIDAWIAGQLDDPMVFKAIDLWISQQQISSAELNLQPLRLTGTSLVREGDHFVLKVRGQGIQRVELQVFDLAGRRLLHQSATGTYLRFHAAGDSGRRWANGVCLYVVTVRGYDGKVVHSEVKKLVVVR